MVASSPAPVPHQVNHDDIQLPYLYRQLQNAHNDNRVHSMDCHCHGHRLTAVDGMIWYTGHVVPNNTSTFSESLVAEARRSLPFSDVRELYGYGLGWTRRYQSCQLFSHMLYMVWRAALSFMIFMASL